MIHCDYCGKPFEPINDDQRFCCQKHKAAWHRENVPHGTVARVNLLKCGEYAVTVRFKDLPVGVQIGCFAWVETGHSTRTDTAHDNGNA